MVPDPASESSTASAALLAAALSFLLLPVLCVEVAVAINFFGIASAKQTIAMRTTLQIHKYRQKQNWKKEDKELSGIEVVYISILF
tara:strand:- start:352 stop:609 length:258 start_codon:yes stop_codon:yes gene_type:complete